MFQEFFFHNFYRLREFETLCFNICKIEMIFEKNFARNYEKKNQYLEHQTLGQPSILYGRLLSFSLMPCPSIGSKLFWTVQIILVEYQSFWTGSIYIGWVKIILDRPKFWKLVWKNLIWTWQNWYGPKQNNFDSTKIIWTQPKQFGQSQIILDL